MAPKPTQKALQYCHPFSALDGIFWKNRWNLTLLLAVTIDGNDEILLLTWAIVLIESAEEWGVFFEPFQGFIPSC
jgi:hypothetical protein